MTGTERGNGLIFGSDALASLPTAVQPARPVDIADPLNDTTSILQGAQLIGSKMSRSVGRMGLNDEPFAQYMKAKAEKDARDAQEERELAMLAAWSKEKTTLCGVEMTNGEAQQARQRVIANDEAYANWAVKTGRISEADKDTFKDAIRRKKELEEKRGRGTLTDGEAQEIDRLNRSRVGQAADAATAEDVLRSRLALDARAQASVSNEALRDTAQSGAPTRSYGDQTPFQALKNASLPPPAALPVAERVKATGLDL